MTKYISVPDKTRIEFWEAFGRTKEVVWTALNFKSDNDLAKRIRKTAVETDGTGCGQSKHNFIHLSEKQNTFGFSSGLPYL